VQIGEQYYCDSGRLIHKQTWLYADGSTADTFTDVGDCQPPPPTAPGDQPPAAPPPAPAGTPSSPTPGPGMTTPPAIQGPGVPPPSAVPAPTPGTPNVVTQPPQQYTVPNPSTGTVNITVQPAPVTVTTPPVVVNLPDQQQLITSIDRNALGIFEAINQEAAWVRDAITAAVGTIAPSLQEIATEGIRQIATSLGTLGTLIPQPDQTWSALLEQLKAQWPAFSLPLFDWLWKAISEGLHNWLDRLETEGAPSVRALVGSTLALPDLPAETRAVLEDAQATTSARSGLLGLGVQIGAGLIALDRVLSVIHEPLQQQVLAKLQPTIVTASEAVSALRRGQLAGRDAQDITLRLGLSEGQSRILFDLTRQFLGAADLLDLGRRGLVDVDTQTAGLAQLGYEQREIDWLRALQQVLPGVGDVVRFLVREVYTPAVAEVFGQFQEYPDQADAEFAKRGLSSEDARRYWAAHWELPSLTSGYEMLHRTTDAPYDQLAEPVRLPSGQVVYRLLSRDGMALLQRAQDVMPFWRGRLQAISFNPYTRVDVRRAYKIGVLTLDDVFRNYIDLGYDERHAGVLTQFTARDVDEEKRQERELVSGGLRTRIIQAYLNGRNDEPTTRAALAQLGYSQQAVDAFIAEAQYVREEQRNTKILTSVGRLYTSGQWTEDQAREELSTQGFSVAEQNHAFDSWHLDRRYKELTDEQKHQKDLTAAEILAAREELGVSADETLAHLVALGYDQQEAETRLALADHRAARAETKAQQDAIHAQYVAGRIDQHEAGQQLDALGTPYGQRNGLLARWQVERETHAPNLPLVELEKLAKSGKVSANLIRDYLHEVGWLDEEVNLVLTAWDVHTQEAQAREQARATALTAREAKAAQRQVAREQAAAARRVTTAQQALAARLARETRSARRQQLVLAWRAGDIDDGALRSGLVNAGYSAATAAAILGQEVARLHRRGVAGGARPTGG